MAQAKGLIPDNINNQQGKLRSGRGNLDEERMFIIWDVVPHCRVENCPAFHLCEYQKDRNYKCKVIAEYLRNIQIVFFRNLYDNLTEDIIMRIGLELIPLYKQLVRLKIEEVGLTSTLDTDDKGIVRISPLMKEIRETIRGIGTTWKSIGLTEPWGMPRPAGSKKIRGANQSEDTKTIEGDFTNGNPSYHSNLEKEIAKEQEEHRRKKEEEEKKKHKSERLIV